MRITNYFIYTMFLLASFVLTTVISCKKEEEEEKAPPVTNDNENGDANTFKDNRDGTIYQIVTIEEQVWLAENLKYLPSVVGPDVSSETVSYYYVYGYEGTSVSDAKAYSNYDTYGVLYNWTAATTACPNGWHLPSDAEWTQLTDYFEGVNIAGGKLKETGITHWRNPNVDATNESGFTALPGGVREYDETFNLIENYGYWWSSTSDSSARSWGRSLAFNTSTVYRNRYNKDLGFSIRCIKDN